MSDTFLAFVNNTLEAAVSQDIATEIDEKNGWQEPDERLNPQISEETIILAAEGLSEFIAFCFDGQRLDLEGKGMRTAIRRFVSICWVIKSQVLVGPNGKPVSLDKLAKQPQVRCSRCTLSLLAQEFGERWGFRARVQKRETTKPNYARAAVRGWRKRRRRLASKKKISK